MVIDDSNMNHIKTTLVFVFTKYSVSRKMANKRITGGFGVYKNCSAYLV